MDIFQVVSPLVAVLLAAVSFLAGFIDSIAGGGGLLLVPALVSAGLPPSMSLGTNKFAATFGTSIAVFNYAKNKVIVWKAVLSGFIFALLGSMVGTKFVLLLDENTIAAIILFLLPIAAIVTFLRKKSASEISALNNIALFLYIPLLCFFIGMYDGFFGPGTGSFLLIAFYVFLHLQLLQASATAKVFNFLSNLGALFIFIQADKIFYQLGVLLAITNVAGNFLGSQLALKNGKKIIFPILLLSLTILFVFLVFEVVSK